MPVGNFTTTRSKTVLLDVKGQSTASIKVREKDQFLKIAPALPILPGPPVSQNLVKRTHTSHGPTGSTISTKNEEVGGCDIVSLHWTQEGKTVVATRTALEREKNPDRICLDRRGLTTFPTIKGEARLKLLSLQHNLLTRIGGINFIELTKLVFLDLYDNQIEKICSLNTLESLRLLLIGKNRIKKIEGLEKLIKLEVLDLHGNQIVQVSGLETLIALKVLNLAGNNIKIIGCNDFHGLTCLKELNLKRNKIKKLLGFGGTPNLQKLYLSNNDIQKIEDMGSLAKALQIREITIDGNPITLNNDYISFLVSYLPNLQLLSSTQINEQIRRTSMAWRTNKERSNSALLDLSTQICMNVRREEVISNAKTNWELYRCRPKHSEGNQKTNNTKINNTAAVHLHDSNKYNSMKSKALDKSKSQGFGSLTSINENIDGRKIYIKKRSNSTDNLLKLKDATKVYPLEFKLPPILGSIIDSLTNTVINKPLKDNSDESEVVNNLDSTSNSDLESSESLQSSKSNSKWHMFNPNARTSSMDSDKALDFQPNNAKNCSSVFQDDNSEFLKTMFDDSQQIIESRNTLKSNVDNIQCVNKTKKQMVNRTNHKKYPPKFYSSECSTSSKSSSIDSFKSLLSASSNSSNTRNSLDKTQLLLKEKSRIKSGHVKKTVYYKTNRAATARAKFRVTAPPSPPPPQNVPKEREQGGDYLIEIVGRYLNVYGQGALRFIDRHWESSKAQDVNTVKFHYVQFNSITMLLNRLKCRFQNAEHFVFKETNICYLGQLNALAEVQGLTSIQIEPEGNPIVTKDWKPYAIFRLAHWGLKIINSKKITEEEIESANREYAGLIDIVTWSLPESLLQPLLQKLHLEKVQKQNGEQITAKQFLFSSDPALKCVVAKEALQWRKGCISQDDLILRHKGKLHLTNLINLTVDAIDKLELLENKWPNVLYEIVRNALLDFSQMKSYMQQYNKMLEHDK